MVAQEIAELVQRNVCQGLPAPLKAPREDPRARSAAEEERGAVQAEGGRTWLDPGGRQHFYWVYSSPIYSLICAQGVVNGAGSADIKMGRDCP